VRRRDNRTVGCSRKQVVRGGGNENRKGGDRGDWAVACITLGHDDWGLGIVTGMRNPRVSAAG
jgi:hypothetical protein